MTEIRNILYRDALANSQPYMRGELPHTLISNAKELAVIALCSREGRGTLRAIASNYRNICLQLIDTNAVNLEELVPNFINAMSADATFPVIISDSNVVNSFRELSDVNGILGGEVYFPGFEILINRHVCITLRRSVLSVNILTKGFEACRTDGGSI